MIHLILNMLRSQLRDYILQVSGSTLDEPAVVLGNIGLATSLGGSENYMQDTVVISLVNMIEEAALKNSSPYRNVNNSVETTSTPAFMNLFLLFTANFATPQGTSNSSDLYINGITRLSQVIEFFQNKQVFTIQNSPDGTNLQNPALQDIRISMELFSLTFEQVNHLWGSLGGKQMPFVMYLARVLPVRRNYVTGRGEIIQDVQSDVVEIQK